MEQRARALCWHIVVGGRGGGHRLSARARFHRDFSHPFTDDVVVSTVADRLARGSHVALSLIVRQLIASGDPGET